jgi:hypothetical protein
MISTNRALLLNRFIDDASKGTIDIAPSVVDLMEIQLELHDNALHRAGATRGDSSALIGAIRLDRVLLDM